MDLVVYDDDEKRYVPWAVALAAVLLVALVTAGMTFVLARQASGGEQQAISGGSPPEPATEPTSAASTPTSAPTAVPAPSAPVVVPTPAQACIAALVRADAALDRSQAVEQALAEHTAIMDELLAERITAEQTIDRALPVLTDGATQRKRLEDAVAAYQESREQCPS